MPTLLWIFLSVLAPARERRFGQRCVARKALGIGGDIPEHHIPPPTWAFALKPADGNRTRFLIRWRSQTSRSLYDLLFNKYLLEPIHFTMERKMLLGIQKRAEIQIGVS